MVVTQRRTRSCASSPSSVYSVFIYIYQFNHFYRGHFASSTRWKMCQACRFYFYSLHENKPLAVSLQPMQCTYDRCFGLKIAMQHSAQILSCDAETSLFLVITNVAVGLVVLLSLAVFRALGVEVKI